MSNLKNSNNVSEDIQIEAPRGRSIIASINILRELSVQFNASSMEYAAYMEAQSDDLNWANQMEAEIFQLSYIAPKEGKTNI